ncbi:anti-sigma factor family protein [Salinicola halimionae]|uniref:anti-sigma factor family protein n=1 Tax=Salinicola halimionae TaxID=1949081 RepID=UPI000DA1FC79|nr:anti-sigma factor [Salinicola halimionae]
MNPRHPTEQDLHAYLDDQLDAERRQWIESWLQANPDQSAELEKWRVDARRLRARYANPEQWPDNPALDPAAIRRRQRANSQRWLATAAMLVMAVGIGMTGGWKVHDMMTPPSISAQPMADAVQAYRLFTDNVSLNRNTAIDGNGIVDASDTAVTEPDANSRERIVKLFQAHFSDGIMPPDLSAAGLEMTGARLLATDQGPAAMVVYRDQTGRQMMMYIRPPGAGNHMLEPGKRIDGKLMAQYWSKGNYNYAVVSQPDDPNAAMLEEMLRES